MHRSKPSEVFIFVRFASAEETDSNLEMSRMYYDLYILFAFIGFIVGSFVLFFTINVSKARLGVRHDTNVYVIDLPPHYTDVVPPPYDWALQQHYSSDRHVKMFASFTNDMCQ
ncbi:unnamed protein product [Thelazia callipaeda]|uniref:PDR_CDR domain-containing protein n=1 Tax=Thelazia callipaeda TaxID=103827 RepID=A0A0N5CPC8_THECL|nr:unnamed protein product [Thelazia callipaeda]